MTKDEGNPNDEIRKLWRRSAEAPLTFGPAPMNLPIDILDLIERIFFVIRHSSLGFLSSFVIRIFLCLGPLVTIAQAQLVPQVSVRSQSGQFIAQAPKADVGAAPARNSTTNQSFIRLEPNVLAVSCERIKQILYREIGATAPWRGRIYVTLYSAPSDETVTLTAEHFRDGWHYRLELPQEIGRGRYVRALVQTLLLEMANRTAGERSAELPPWLIEGLAQKLLASSELEIFLPAPNAAAGNGVSLAFMQFKGRRENPLEWAHQQLSATPALTFEQLSWPPADQFAGPVAQSYSASAQLFVHELLRLKEGRACLQAMLAQLPEHYNWQFAFLRGFHQWFQGPRDVEKWWALHVVHFTGRELTQAWPLDESFLKLDQMLHAGVQLRTGTNDMPLRAEASLQKIIREWDRPRQKALFEDKLRELSLMRLRVPQQVLVLVEGYRQAIELYLTSWENKSFSHGLFRKAAQKRAAEETIAKLDELDGQRLAMRPAPVPLPVPLTAGKSE